MKLPVVPDFFQAEICICECKHKPNLY